MRNFRLYNNTMVKTRLCAVSLVGILLTGPLFGCAANSNEKTKKDSILVDIGDTTYSFEINNCTVSGGGLAECTLGDGSKLNFDHTNMIHYNGDSTVMQSIINDSDIVEIDTVYSEPELDETDMMMLEINGEIKNIGIKKYTWCLNGIVIVKLLDDTEINVNSEDVVFYNSKSKTMDQVEECIKSKKLSK